MKSKPVLLFAALLGCAVASHAAELSTAPAGTPVARVTVEMTAATLGDDCGAAPVIKQKSKPNPRGRSESDSMNGMARQDRRCEPTSMQLSVIAPAGVAPTTLRVKKVELFDENGKLLGELAAGAPTLWSVKAGAYQAWDQKIAAGQSLAVSYPLSEPDWSAVKNRRNQTYLLKALVTVGGSDQTVQRDVPVFAPVQLPPNVRT